MYALFSYFGGAIILTWVILEIRSLKAKAELLKKSLNLLEVKNADLEALSVHDDLTGITNRRGCDYALSHQWSVLERHPREENDFSVLLLDLCLFKQINDAHGHDVGDKVLRFIAQVLTGLLRDTHDLVARRGGDEFLIILPETGTERAIVVADKIRDTLASHPFVYKDISIYIHVSIGISNAIDLDSAGRIIVYPLSNILRAADMDMYRNKQEDHKALGNKR